MVAVLGPSCQILNVAGLHCWQEGRGNVIDLCAEAHFVILCQEQIVWQAHWGPLVTKTLRVYLPVEMPPCSPVSLLDRQLFAAYQHNANDLELL